MKTIFPLLILMLSLQLSQANAQNKTRTITGIIFCEDSQTPIEGAAVQIKGTKNISGSLADGIFYISISPTDSIIVVSHPEYYTREIKITSETEYQIDLKKKAQIISTSIYSQPFPRSAKNNCKGVSATFFCS